MAAPTFPGQTGSGVMRDTDRRTRNDEHFTEEDCVDFTRGQSRPEHRERLQRHLGSGCTRCADAVRLWERAVAITHEEASYSPPAEILRQLKGDFALRHPRSSPAGALRRVALVFDSLRQPLASGVRAAGIAPQQLLYKAGRYTIRLRVEPAADAERTAIIGQILDELDPASTLQDIAVLAVRGNETLDRTLTNRLGEFLLEPDARENLQLCVGVAEIGTFTVQPARRTRRTDRRAAARGLASPGRRKRARRQ
jgi:hypothetical protein